MRNAPEASHEPHPYWKIDSGRITESISSLFPPAAMLIKQRNRLSVFPPIIRIRRLARSDTFRRDVLSGSIIWAGEEFKRCRMRRTRVGYRISANLLFKFPGVNKVSREVSICKFMEISRGLMKESR